MKKYLPRITSDPRIYKGKPIITGTRVPVDIIIGHIAAGDTIEDIMNAYHLTRDDVRAALQLSTS